MVKNIEWKTPNGTKRQMKNAEWDKMSNEKMLNGTKRRIENRKEKYILIFVFLLLLSDYIGTITY